MCEVGPASFSLRHWIFLRNIDLWGFKFSLGAKVSASTWLKHESVLCDLWLTVGIGLILQWADLTWSVLKFVKVGQNGTTAKAHQRKTQGPSFCFSQAIYRYLLFYIFIFLSLLSFYLFWFYISSYFVHHKKLLFFYKLSKDKSLNTQQLNSWVPWSGTSCFKNAYF